ncbi:MAG: hypothetical protein LWX83_15325 [Anaerolineae bacterium]|nr:hypothetical protein [Anaerolineae bacterium]
MAYTLDTPLGTLLDKPEVKTTIEQHFPGISDNPLTGMLRGVTLNMILSLPQAEQIGLTKERAEAMLVEVNKFVQ